MARTAPLPPVFGRREDGERAGVEDRARTGGTGAVAGNRLRAVAAHRALRAGEARVRQFEEVVLVVALRERLQPTGHFAEVADEDDFACEVQRVDVDLVLGVDHDEVAADAAGRRAPRLRRRRDRERLRGHVGAGDARGHRHPVGGPAAPERAPRLDLGRDAPRLEPVASPLLGAVERFGAGEAGTVDIGHPGRVIHHLAALGRFGLEEGDGERVDRLDGGRGERRRLSESGSRQHEGGGEQESMHRRNRRMDGESRKIPRPSPDATPR